MARSPGTQVPSLLKDPASGLTYRVRPAAQVGDPSFLLLAGYGGDEDVLWVIESSLPGGGLVASPRGLFPAEGGGYAWVDRNLGPGGSLHDFDPVRKPLTDWVLHLEHQHGLVIANTYLVGFSQGSALAFAVSAFRDLQPKGLAALAAYLPDGDLGGLEGLPIFWSHGTRDERVPVARARSDVQRLRAAGAKIAYCETDTGHKVGIECMRTLKEWLRSA